MKLVLDYLLNRFSWVDIPSNTRLKRLVEVIAARCSRCFISPIAIGRRCLLLSSRTCTESCRSAERMGGRERRERDAVKVLRLETVNPDWIIHRDIA